MKRLSAVLIVSSSVLLSIGCSHFHKVDGVEGTSEIPSGVRVNIGGTEVREGDTLVVSKKTCQKAKHTRPRGSPIQKCSTARVGTAKVLKVLDHDSAIVEPVGALKMDETMTVEKE